MDHLDSDAMAKAMGFASFGAQNPSKKRKFNHAADAIVATPDLSLPSHRPPPGSASNAVPLGIRSRTQNTDEIDLEEDDGDDADGETVPAITTSQSEATTSTAPRASVTHQVGASHTTGQSPQQGGRSGRGGYVGRGRDANASWWTDYYDPSANVNPWERLEQEHGLQPRGPWMTWDEAKSKA